MGKYRSIFTLAVVMIFCASCEEGVESSVWNLEKDEYVNLVRLSAAGNKEAARQLLTHREMVEDRAMYIKWSDRLAALGDASGVSKGASARSAAAYELEPGDPERLMLLVEALKLEQQIAVDDWVSERSIEILNEKIVAEEKELERQYGPVRPLGNAELREDEFNSDGRMTNK